MVQQSLFDDLETEAGAALPPVPAARTPRHVGQPTAAERAFWEDWKARALAGFVVPYCRTIAASRLHRSCWWVDGLGSTGRTAGALAGSAISDAIEALAATSFTLRALRLETHPPRSQGQETIQPQAAPANEEPARNGHKQRKTPAQEQQPAQEIPASASRSELPEMLGTTPAVLLLNPFAASPLTAEDLLPLCQRRANTELLLTISAAQVERLAAQSLADTGAGAPPPALTALLRSDAWKSIWIAEGTGERSSAASKVARTLDLLQGLLKPHFLYVCLAPLGDTPTPRHFLLFASRHYSGLVLMNDFLCAELARLAREREAHALQGDWFAKRRQKARASAWAALKEELHTLGLARRARLWPDLKPALVLAHFGQFSTSDYDAALRELIQEGRVSCRWSPAVTPDSAETQDSPPAERTPGQQDFLEFIEAKTRPVWRRS
jgi:hypothetical protein